MHVCWLKLFAISKWHNSAREWEREKKAIRRKVAESAGVQMKSNTTRPIIVRAGAFLYQTKVYIKFERRFSEQLVSTKSHRRHARNDFILHLRCERGGRIGFRQASKFQSHAVMNGEGLPGILVFCAVRKALCAVSFCSSQSCKCASGAKGSDCAEVTHVNLHC